MDENNLPGSMLALQSPRASRQDAPDRSLRVTHPVREVLDQVVDDQIARFELAVQPFGKGLLLDVHPEVGRVLRRGYRHF